MSPINFNTKFFKGQSRQEGKKLVIKSFGIPQTLKRVSLNK